MRNGRQGLPESNGLNVIDTGRPARNRAMLRHKKQGAWCQRRLPPLSRRGLLSRLREEVRSHGLPILLIQDGGLLPRCTGCRPSQGKNLEGHCRRQAPLTAKTRQPTVRDTPEQSSKRSNAPSRGEAWLVVPAPHRRGPVPSGPSPGPRAQSLKLRLPRPRNEQPASPATPTLPELSGLLPAAPAAGHLPPVSRTRSGPATG